MESTALAPASAEPRRVSARMCRGCPFNPGRDWRAVPYVEADWRTAGLRIARGERWICHESCGGPWITPKALFCRGAADGLPLVIPPGAPLPVRLGETLDVRS